MNEDTKPQGSRLPEDIFADTESSKKQSAPRIPSQKTPQVSDEHYTPHSGNKVMKLMIGAIVAIVIIGVGFAIYAYMSSQGEGGATESSEVIAEGENPEDATDGNIPSIPEAQLGELANEFTNVLDSDFDGLSDERERELGLDASLSDTDGDNLSDRDEVDIYFTDPLNIDTDGDGFLDGDEVRRGFDPNGPGTLFVIPTQN